MTQPTNLQTWPERIWLQHGDDGDPIPAFGPLQEVTWCQNNINGSDIEYVRADVAKPDSVHLAVPVETATDTRVKALEKAVEFAEYMAKGADDLLRSIYSCQEVENKVDAAEDGAQLVAAEHELEIAKEAAGEYMSGLRNDVYEFRKRRDRIPAIQSGISSPSFRPNEQNAVQLSAQTAGGQNLVKPAEIRANAASGAVVEQTEQPSLSDAALAEQFKRAVAGPQPRPAQSLPDMIKEAWASACGHWLVPADYDAPFAWCRVNTRQYDKFVDLLARALLAQRQDSAQSRLMLADDTSPRIPPNQGSGNDAERYRMVRYFVGGKHPALTDDGLGGFTLHHLKPVAGADIMRGGIAQHFDDAIDAAIANGAPT